MVFFLKGLVSHKMRRGYPYVETLEVRKLNQRHQLSLGYEDGSLIGPRLALLVAADYGKN
jgi:hypothetical protein